MPPKEAWRKPGEWLRRRPGALGHRKALRSETLELDLIPKERRMASWGQE